MEFEKKGDRKVTHYFSDRCSWQMWIFSGRNYVWEGKYTKKERKSWCTNATWKG